MKVCKKIIGSIIILFFILSIISLFYNYYIVQNRMSFIAADLTGEEMHQETISLQGNLTIQIVEKTHYYYGALHILHQFFRILILSVIVGTITGLVISIKDSNRIKYVLFYLLGNVIYNIFFAMCIQGIYSTYEVPITFGMAYIESFKSTWIIYTILFIGVFVIKYLYNKHKTNTLNKLCNKKKKEE